MLNATEQHNRRRSGRSGTSIIWCAIKKSLRFIDETRKIEKEALNYVLR